ncbi:MAG: 2-amino-4-hydroxy-6-hydroxymethyldihydropteridine diphosphokinase [Devosiaceae bacterium]|nr:2-amino-4-hydroxy-6-hydroxymethyldihydropteridine diphosphokinase [Devosiaceae bacterium]
MAKAWLALGANMGDAKAQIESAICHIAQHVNIEISKKSKMIISKAWGNTEQSDFHNIVIEIATEIEPKELLKICQEIENRLGRIRGEKWGPRIIDIDIIAYDRFEIATDFLTLPHPYAHERDFVINLLRGISPLTAEWVIKLAKQS